MKVAIADTSNSLELVLEVLEGQGVLEDGSVINTVGHGSSVDGVCGGHSHGAHGGGEGE